MQETIQNLRGIFRRAGTKAVKIYVQLTISEPGSAVVCPLQSEFGLTHTGSAMDRTDRSVRWVDEQQVELPQKPQSAYETT